MSFFAETLVFHLFERVKNRLEFADVKNANIKIPKFEGKEIKKAVVGACILIGGLGRAAFGIASSFVATGATEAVVIALVQFQQK
ncbi:hypothetical protein [Phocaeicola plebeius]